jgi:hypothetical protein
MYSRSDMMLLDGVEMPSKPLSPNRYANCEFDKLSVRSTTTKHHSENHDIPRETLGGINIAIPFPPRSNMGYVEL